MSDSEMWQSVRLGETRLPWEQWQVTVTWRQVVAPSGAGHVYAAGVELRGWTDPTGLPGEAASRAVLETRGQPPALGSDLLVKRIRWGQVLAEHRAQLEEQLRDRIERVRAAGPLGDGPAAQWAESMDRVADQAGQERAPRATAATLPLVAKLYAIAEREDPQRVALRVLELLQLEGYPLNAANKSDRAKVRRWIVQAGCSNTKRKGSK